MSLEIKRPWARASDRSQRFGGFLTLANDSPMSDRLIEARSPIARRIVMCGLKIVGSEIRMRPLANGLAVPGDTTLTLRPRGYHLYFLGTKPRPKQGEKVPVTLIFEKAGERQIMLDVEAPGPVGKEAVSEKT